MIKFVQVSFLLTLTHCLSLTNVTHPKYFNMLIALCPTGGCESERGNNLLTFSPVLSVTDVQCCQVFKYFTKYCSKTQYLNTKYYISI